MLSREAAGFGKTDRLTSPVLKQLCPIGLHPRSLDAGIDFVKASGFVRPTICRSALSGVDGHAKESRESAARRLQRLACSRGYWLADLCAAEGITFVLGHVPAMPSAQAEPEPQWVLGAAS